ncbi:MAG: hypothetical protein WBA10_02030 [Elainellaceae cyanobacterium]
METIQLTQPIWAATGQTATEPVRPMIELPNIIASSSSVIVLKPNPAPASLRYDPVLQTSGQSDRLRPIGLAAGVALVAAVAAIDQVTPALPSAEAHVAIAAPSTGQAQLDIPTQLEILESPALLEPVVEQLQARDIDITYDSLIQSLTIEAQGETFDIRYRHADADTAQAVIDQLSAAYLSHGQTCRQTACRGLEFIEAELPRIQQRVQTSQTQLRQLHANALPPDQQAKILTARRIDVRRQTIELNQRLAAAYRDKAVLQEQLGLPPQTSAATLLQRDAPYQQRLQALRHVEQQIATEFGHVQGEGGSLRALYQQHNAIAAQLHQEAQGGLRRFLANPRGPVDPVFQQPLYGELLQKLIGVAHQIEMLELRQKTIAQAEALLSGESHRIVSLLRRYEAVQQELLANTRILRNYIDRREQLHGSAASEAQGWQVVSPPAVSPPEKTVLVALPDSPYYIGAIAGLAAVTAAVVVARRRPKVIEGELV